MVAHGGGSRRRARCRLAVDLSQCPTSRRDRSRQRSGPRDWLCRQDRARAAQVRIACRAAGGSGKQGVGNSTTLAPLESTALPANTFWMTEEDRVLAARSTETTTASGVASEWDSAESS